MNILVVNDDSIKAAGIVHLAEAAKSFGNVTVVAPAEQCSAMSQRITIRGSMKLKKHDDFPVEGVEAYSLTGTPADCVKVAVECVLEEKPDIVFSGINKGYNCGVETCYSGTVGAAMEALLKGVPAIAFSVDYNEEYGTVDAYIHDIIKEILRSSEERGEIWNVNFPGIPATECMGILRDRKLSKVPNWPDTFKAEEAAEDDPRFSDTAFGAPALDEAVKKSQKISKDGKVWAISPLRPVVPGVVPGTDLDALERKCISIGKIRNQVLA